MTRHPEPVDVKTPDGRPARVSSTIAVVAGLAAVAALFPTLSVGVVTMLVGLLVLGSGVATGARWAVTGGVAVQAVGLALAALGGVPPVQILLSLTATLVAWDVGQHAIELGRHVDTVSMRAELLHAAGSSFAVGGTAAVAAIIYTVTVGEHPLTALTALVFAALLFLLVLRIE